MILLLVKCHQMDEFFVLTVLCVSFKPVQNQRRILNGQLRNYICGNLFKKVMINTDFFICYLRICLIISIVSFLSLEAHIY